MAEKTPQTPLHTNAVAKRQKREGMGWFLRGEPVPQLEEDVKEKLAALRAQREDLTYVRRMVIGLAILALAGSAAALFLSSFRVAGLFVAAAIVFGSMASFHSTTDVDLEIRDRELELDLSKMDDARIHRAYKLFKDHQALLWSYYHRAHFNSRVMLVVGVLCLALGAAIVVAAVWKVFELAPTPAAAEANQSTQIIIGVLGAVGGILVNYVAAVYLKMYAAASQTFNDFHNRLVTTHHIHLGNYIASRIETDDTREQTLQNMASELGRL